MKHSKSKRQIINSAPRPVEKERPRRGLNTPPGSLIERADTPAPVISIMAYGPDQLVEQDHVSPEAIRPYLDAYPVTWIRVAGLRDAALIRQIGALFGLHDLALEDVMNESLRTKVDVYPDYLFIEAAHAEYTQQLETRQVNIFMGKNYVLTFQSAPSSFGLAIEQRIRDAQGKMRIRKADYLVYALLDSLVDMYFPVLEQYGDHLEMLEARILHNPDESCVPAIRSVKRDLLRFRRVVWPLRDVLNSIIRDNLSGFSPETILYLRDCYDHIIQVMDLTESCREMGSGLMDIYMSCLSNRMDQVMKILTIFSAIFIPLSFIAGVYGMNFNPERSAFNMPELNWKLGYPFALGLMALTAGSLLAYFHLKGWLWKRRRPRPLPDHA